MDQNDDTPVPPTADEVAGAIERAENLLDRVETYRDAAAAKDHAAEAANEDRPLTLDELPYGEELLRTEELPGQIKQAKRYLKQIESQNLPPEKSAQIFEKSEALLQEAEQTLDDCKSIPDEEEEFGDD